ncbi:MAG: ribbon-helix-helix protein, CopG family [Thermaerobacter sp.]|nr:ribbon-helix-helix protein, CopG family [Thermaerobacter sp.]
MPGTVLQAFRLPAELARRLEEKAKRTGQTRTETLVRLLEVGFMAAGGPREEELRQIWRQISQAQEILGQALKLLETGDKNECGGGS